MIKLLIVVCLVLLAISLILVSFLFVKVKRLSRKVRRLSAHICDDNTLHFNQRVLNIEGYVKRMQASINEHQRSLENHKEYIEELMKYTHYTSAPIQQSSASGKDSVNTNHFSSKRDKKNNKKKSDNVENKQQQPVVIKTIYLGINSDDMFFEMEEQKTESSKFVAELTSETEGTFKPIDVERVRAANVTASMKQSGVVSIKDAHSFNVVEPGRILKGEKGWHIESQVVVEFIK